MDLILETERLLLREMRHDDASQLFEMDANPNVHKYLWNKPNTSIDEIDEYITAVRNQYIDNKIGRFLAILKSTNELIGWVGIKFNTVEVNNKNNFYDIGYRLNDKFWGKGYASEATIAWQDYAFNQMNINTLHAATHIDNTASNRILQKTGMTKTETYLEDKVLWNWYEMKNPNLSIK